MKNNKIKSVKRAPKTAKGSKVYTQKKPAKKAKLRLKETIVTGDINNAPAYNNNDTYTTQSNSNTTYITVEGDTLSKYPVTTVSDNSDLLYPTPNDNLKESYDKYSKVAEESEDTKRSEMLPSNNEHTNMIVILIGIAAFAALLLLLI